MGTLLGSVALPAADYYMLGFKGETRMNNKIIKTSDKEWLVQLTSAYKNKQPVTLIDDANVGINPESQTILQMGKQTGLPHKNWMAAGFTLGACAGGVWMIVVGMGCLNPTSKLILLIEGGFMCVVGVGFLAI